MKKKKQLKNKFKTIIILIIILLILAIIALAIIFYNKDRKTADGNNTTATIISDNQITNFDLSIEFLKQENNRQNMLYSPLSIKYALKMLNEGADGNTKVQIQNLIGDIELTSYNNINNVLSLANGIYIRDTYTEFVKENYIDTLSQKYNAEINYDSFNNADNINNWIEHKTLGIIKNMVRDDIVQNPNTEMLLINALGIDMDWENPFDASETYGEDFNLENDNKIMATMMHKEAKDDNVSFYKDNNITALRMDLQKYDDVQLDFIAIMPKENLSEYIKTFSMDDLNNILAKSTLASNTNYGVNISIPKFSFDYDLRLKDDLITLGITDAFDENSANFSNMTSSQGLYVSDALHKANIDFSEQGIKASAATVIVMQDKAMAVSPTQLEEIKFDKPFLYIIRDKNTNEIWFVGTVYEPNYWDNDKSDY